MKKLLIITAILTLSTSVLARDPGCEDLSIKDMVYISNSSDKNFNSVVKECTSVGQSMEDKGKAEGNALLILEGLIVKMSVARMKAARARAEVYEREVTECDFKYVKKQKR